MMFNKPFPEGLYCPNVQCELFGRANGARLERHAYYGADRRVIYLCRECGGTFSETRGTFFFGLRTPREKVLTALKMIAEGGGIRATGRAMGADKRYGSAMGGSSRQTHRRSLGLSDGRVSVE